MSTASSGKRLPFEFTNQQGERLAAALEMPSETPLAFAVFAHCFTCSKDVAAASRISRALAARGIATLRFDFTGLGNSEGDFANSNFSSNVEDLVAAAQALASAHRAPAVLIGHSLGGAAVLAAAERIDSVTAVVTIGAPAQPAHVAHLFDDARETIEREGSAGVTLGGRRFTVKKQFLEDLDAQSQLERIGRLRRSLLVMHSPVDDVVGIDNAATIFQAARHPKSFVSLDSADHLLSRREDSEYVADTIATWARRYAVDAARPAALEAVPDQEVLVRETGSGFTQEILTDRHRLLADEPREVGGTDLGMSPYELLMAALGACTTMTLRMYATRRKLPLARVAVRLRHDRIHAGDCADCENDDARIDRIQRHLTLDGPLDASQRERLLDIADRCPVHRTLHAGVRVETVLQQQHNPTIAS
jgi:putative redox protein